MNTDFIKKANQQAKIFETEYPDKSPEYDVFKNEMRSIIDKDYADLTSVKNTVNFLNNIIELYNNIKDSYLEYYKEKHDGDFIPDNVLIDKQISLLYFNNSGVYNLKDNYTYPTPDVLKIKKGTTLRTGLSSKFTFALYISSLTIEQCEKNKDKNSIKLISDLITQLLFTVANIFHPSVIANVLKFAMTNYKTPNTDTDDDNYKYEKRNILEYLLKDEYEITIKTLFETLVIREGNLLSNRLDYTPGLVVDDKTSVSCDDLVFSVLSGFVIKSFKDILDDSNRNNWFNTILSNPVYDKFKKQLYTNALCNITVNIDSGENETINTCRYLREKATEWIKCADLSKRPNLPEPFEYIDITNYLETLYSYSIYHIGDVEATVNKFDAQIKELEDSINKLENPTISAEPVEVDIDPTEVKEEERNTEDVKENSNASVDESSSEDKYLSSKKEKLKEIVARKKHYLTLKSLIGFLFLEILSNEKLCDKVYTPEFVLYVMMNEPGIDNAMHDIHSAIMALYSKRDFKPMSVPSNNPFFIHYGEGKDVASPEAKYIAKLLSGLAHYNMSSRVVASSVYSFRELGNAICSTGISFAMYETYFVLTLRNNFKYLTSYVECDNISDKTKKEISDTLHELVNLCDNKKIISEKGVNDVLSVINHLLDEIKHAGDTVPSDLLYAEYYSNIIKSAIVDYMDSAYRITNIYKVLYKIVDNTSSDIARDTFLRDKSEGKTQYSLWPRIVQYEYPIIAEDHVHKTREETHHDNFMDLEPGDITSGYYKDPKPRTKTRYSTTKTC